MKHFPSFVFLFVFCSFVSISSGQSALHSLDNGQWLPVAYFKSKVPYCFTGDDLVLGDKKQFSLMPAADFGEGFVDVVITRHLREGVVNSDGVLRFLADESWYTFECQLIADRDMEDCYYALSFDAYGKRSFYCRSLGDLRAGKPKSVKIYIRVGYEMPEQLHVFSGMEEVRTSLIPETYRYESGDILFASK